MDDEYFNCEGCDALICQEELDPFDPGEDASFEDECHAQNAPGCCPHCGQCQWERW